MRSFEKPTEEDVRNLENFMFNTRPLAKKEESWVWTTEDLVALRPPKEPDWLERKLERLLVVLPIGFIKVSAVRPIQDIQ